MKPLWMTLIGISIWLLLEMQPPWMIHKFYLWGILSRQENGVGLMHALLPVAISFVLAMITYRYVRDYRHTAPSAHTSPIARWLVRRVHALRLTLNRLWETRTSVWTVSVVFLVLGVPVSIYAGFAALQHAAFSTYAWDAGIFEQAIFLLSRGELPASTVRQITNLFFDHQNMALVIMAPLYWISNGWNGYLLQLSSVVLVLILPVIVLWRAGVTITRTLLHDAPIRTKRTIEAMVLLLVSMIFVLHPGTMGAVRFSFHAIYLAIPCMAVLLWIAARLVVRKTPAPLFIETIIALCMATIWVFCKEDQWIFVLSFFVQLCVGIPLLRALFRRYSPAYREALEQQTALASNKLWLTISTALLALAGIVYPILHTTVVVEEYQFPSHSYTFLIEEKIENTTNHLAKARLWAAVQELQLFDHQQNISYQQFLSFNAIGLAALPLNVLGWHAERLIIGVPRIISLFHYGVAEPLHASAGMIVIFSFFVLKRASVRTLRNATIAFGMFLWMGMATFTGSTPVGSLFFDLELLQTYQRTQPLREMMHVAHDRIGPTDSVLADETLLPHIAARPKVALFRRLLITGPEVLDPASSIYDFPFDVIDEGDYEWWILRLDDHTLLRSNIGVFTYLKGHDYEIVFQNESGAILHNPNCSMDDQTDCQ